MSSSLPPLLENATRDLARFGAALRYEDLPREVVERIKLCVLDSIGCTLFGATLPWTRKVADLALAEGARPVASLIGMGKKTSVSLAALVNGTAGHAFELDDIHKESIIHMGSLATPVAFAFAEERGASGARRDHRDDRGLRDRRARGQRRDDEPLLPRLPSAGHLRRVRCRRRPPRACSASTRTASSTRSASSARRRAGSWRRRKARW